MTTFIDFRYSVAQASALQHGFVEGNQSLNLALDDGYIVLEFISEPTLGIIFSAGDFELLYQGDRILVFKNSVAVVRHPISFEFSQDKIIAVWFSSDGLGIRYRGTIEETRFEKQAASPSLGQLVISDSLRIMGIESGRGAIWSKIYYQRKEPRGLAIEIVMDWQNLQSGIPTSGISIAEELLQQSDYKLVFTSYACDESQAQNSDFSRLFSSKVKPNVRLHIAPPIYTQATPDAINIGIFVVESEKVADSIINRCNQMDALIVPTNFVAKVLIQNGVSCPIYVQPYGVDLNFFTPAKSKTALKSGKGFNILAVAAYTERKNIYHLARAFMEEFGINEDIALHLYIRPEYLMTQNNILQEFTEWENWHFNQSGLILISTSYTSRENLRDLYANADLYLMPSNEGFGFTILEAMACGTPAIGLGYGGQTDFLNSENGYVVAPDRSYVCKNMDLLPYVGDIFYAPNIRQLRKILRYAFDNRAELVELGKMARQSVELKYSWTEYGRSIISLIDKIAGNTKRKLSAEIKKQNTNSVLTWMLGVVDDTSIDSILPKLKAEQQKGIDVICLFTRYGNYKDAIKARRNGFLLYRWDTTLENFRTLASQLVKSPWVGLLYPEDNLKGDIQSLIRFLEDQPAEVSEVKIKGELESRFFRLNRKRASGKVIELLQVQFS